MTLQTVITLFNAKLGADRREVFFPTIIDSASYTSRRASSSSKGVHNEDMTYSLRIPVNARVIDDKTYVDEKVFKAMSDEELAGLGITREIAMAETNLFKAMRDRGFLVKNAPLGENSYAQ